MFIRQLKAWIKASRLAAQSFIFPSLLLGQIINYYQSGNFLWQHFLLIHLYGLTMHLSIVYANDYADLETDQINQTSTPFTGGSRVLLAGQLKPLQLLKGSLIMAFLSVMLGGYLSLINNNYLLIFLIVLGLFLNQAYSFKPIKMSYRGFGELLQMIGVGIILPLVGFLAQGGLLRDLPWQIILIFLPAQLAMALATSLPDEPSDRISSKNTTVVFLGLFKAKFLIVFLYLLSFLLLQQIYNTYIIGRGGSVFITVLLLLLSSQLFLVLFSSAVPGTRSLSCFVFLAILTTQAFLIGFSYLLLLV